MKLKNNNKKLMIYLVAVVSILIGGSLLAWSTSDNVGQISKKSSQQPDYQPALHTLKGTHVEFEHSNSYQVQKLPAKDGDLERYILRATPNFEKQLAVVVSNLVDGKVETNSAYLLRQSMPSVYASSAVVVSDNTATVFTKNDGLEKTILIPHNDKVAVLAFTTTGPNDNLNFELDSLLKTFKWND